MRHNDGCHRKRNCRQQQRNRPRSYVSWGGTSRNWHGYLPYILKYLTRLQLGVFEQNQNQPISDFLRKIATLANRISAKRQTYRHEFLMSALPPRANVAMCFDPDQYGMAPLADRSLRRLSST